MDGSCGTLQQKRRGVQLSEYIQQQLDTMPVRQAAAPPPLAHVLPVPAVAPDVVTR